MPDTPDRDAIRRRLETATPRPWTRDVNYVVGEIPGGRPGGEVIVQCWPTVHGHPGYPQTTQVANAEFIAHAPADIAALLAYTERLEKDRAALHGALLLHGQHAALCAMMHDHVAACTCGLDAALARREGGQNAP